MDRMDPDAGGRGGLRAFRVGPWPDRRTLTFDSQLAILRLLGLVAQKGDLLAGLLTVELGLLVVLFGRRFKAAGAAIHRRSPSASQRRPWRN